MGFTVKSACYYWVERMKSHRVFVTGLGVVSSYGSDLNTFWEAVKSGRSAIQPWIIHGVPDFPVKYAATIDMSKLEETRKQLLPVPTLERRSVFGLIAANNALAHAGIKAGAIPSMGLATCSGVPEICDEEMYELSKKPFPECLNHYRPKEGGISGLSVSNDNLAAAIAEKFELNGPVLNINGACAGAAMGIGMAYESIRRGESTAMLAGGADSVTNIRVMSGLFLLGATATTSTKKNNLCCPFDADRSGLVAGEGGAFLVLESESSAVSRGARIYAEVIGYGNSMDAYKATAPHPDGTGAIKAMKGALRTAGLSPDDIDYINAHGTSTPLNDVIETKAIKAVFGCSGKTPAVSSTKSMIGHWISAAAAPEAIATVMALGEQIVPPTINLEKPDKQCDLDYVVEGARPREIRYALSNSFGFGGFNATLAFGAYNGK